MREEIKRFCNIYKRGYTSEIILDDGYFILKEKAEKSFPMKIISFIKENPFLSKMKDIYVYKIKRRERNYYLILLTYKNVKIQIYTDSLDSYIVHFLTHGDIWTDMYKLNLNDFGFEYSEINSIVKELFENIKNNTDERINILLKKL